MNFILSWFLAKAKDYVLTNWKTTLGGVIAWALTHYLKLDAQETAKIVGDVLLLLGIVAKDGDKSGTTAQPREVPSAPVPATPPAPAQFVYEKTDPEPVVG